jgi:hypothetical protein
MGPGAMVMVFLERRYPLSIARDSARDLPVVEARLRSPGLARIRADMPKSELCKTTRRLCQTFRVQRIHGARRRPRAIDYLMWAVVGLTMAMVLRAVLSIDNPLAWRLGLGYVALGAVLMWRRRQSLSG